MRLGSRKIKLFIWLFVLLIIFLLWLLRPQSQSTIISPIPNTNSAQTQVNALNPSSPTVDSQGSLTLRNRLAQTIAGKLVNYSISIRDYNSDFILETGSATIFDAASVNKLPILAALYYLVGKGEISLDKTVTIQSEDIHDYGTGSIHFDKPGSTYSIQTLARLMIQKSDNTAAYILSNHILTLEQIQELLKSWGMSQTDITENKTSNQDIALLLKKMYSGSITNPALTQEMFGFLKDTDFEDRLPALLPKDVTVYHKIGTTLGGIHDVGIVVGPNTKYYIGIFTRDINNDEETINLIAKISLTVYEFMSKQSI